jgi:Sensors of blue-light using FAD
VLANLVYLSIRQADSPEADIAHILAQAQQNNSKDGITGVLLYSATRFVQYLEGEYQLIDSLYSKIKRDPRHYRVTLLHTGLIGHRYFPSWHMGSKYIDEADICYLTDLDETEKALFQSLLNGEALGANAQPVLAVVRKFFK